ncbi:hypothetical protein BJ508DRAFT_173477 [Ascobolus immersus RN42]|uniref:Uncharacterized protein n=1 Tax=Ascobolus immersus RN42 TaxID=1160509 RepID=A0A3N4HTX5_ASCIM|nr:hypothetical protein BJ508DRAFT_173477 [Ascobolus immersus RN42]
MKTVSTLCATSTVGVAACGLALARPNHQDQVHDNLRLRDLRSPSPAISNYDPRIEVEESQEECSSPLPPSIRKSWIRRFSETVSNAVPTSRNTAPRPHSALATSRSTSASAAAAEHQGPPTQTRNKLVKRSISRGSVPPHSPTSPSVRRSFRPFSAKNTPVVSVRSRYAGTESPVPTEPATARPSTTLFSGAQYQPYDPIRFNNWKLFFRPRRQKTKPLTPPSIKRIYPDHKSYPTLTYPQFITNYDSDTESTYSPANSIYCESRPLTPSSPFPVVEEEQQEQQQESSTRTRRKSFSISTLLPSQRPPTRSDSTRSRRLSIDVVFKRPSSAARTNPYPSTSSRSAMAGRRSEEQRALATLQSISNLNIASNNASSTAVVSPQSQQFASDTQLPREPTDLRLSQLSISGNSERASTLVGSDAGGDHAEGDGFDDMSETVFDSLRTRLSDVPPRAEGLFSESGPVANRSPNRLTEESKQQLDRQGALSNRLSSAGGWNDAEEEEDWDVSDWDATSSDGRNELEATPKPLPKHKALFGEAVKSDKKPFLDTSLSLFNKDRNKSGSSFNSLGDWDDEALDVPESPTKAKSRSDKLAFHSLRLGRQAPPVHTRSSSVPGYSRARVSENWDDDFDECDGPEVHIPEAICAVSSSVLDHLAHVKEFASLVEDLKRLRQLGNSSGARYGPNRKLWEEAEGIIALATLEDEDSASTGTAPKKVRPSFDSSTFDPPSTASSNKTTKAQSINHRKSILPDDDDIFGATKGFDTNTVPKLPPPFPRSTTPSSNGFHTPQSSPSRSIKSSPSRSVKRAPSVKEDKAVEAAKHLLDRVNRRTCDSPERKSVVSTTSGWSIDEDEKEKEVHFDTDMLGELVVRVQELIPMMEEALEKCKIVGPLKRMSSTKSKRVSVVGKEVFDIEGRKLEGMVST